MLHSQAGEDPTDGSIPRAVRTVALYHLTQLSLAMEAITGGQWKGVMNIKNRFALAVQLDKDKTGVFIDPNGWSS